LVVVSGEFELFLPASRSLKDKRQVLASLKERLRRRFEVAVAEVDHQDRWQRARLGIVTVSSSARRAEEVLCEALRYVEGDLRVQVVEHIIEER